MRCYEKILRASAPLAEDQVHGLGQVVHRAVGRHSRVPLVAGPEERRGRMRLEQRRKGQEQTVDSVNKGRGSAAA